MLSFIGLRRAGRKEGYPIMNNSVKKYIAEFIGTLVLVVFACGTAAFSGCNGAEFNVAYVGTALAFGLVIVAMAYSIGNISGCHINPAVSLGMLVAGKMSVKDFCGYVIAQFLGGIAGAAFLKWIQVPGGSLGQNGLYNNDFWMSAVIEIVLTCIFVLVILGVTSRKASSPFAGLVIGGALTLVHLLGIHFTGTSVNPARSFGPALFSGTLSSVPVFIIAPLVGGALAAIIWKLIDTKEEA